MPFHWIKTDAVAPNPGRWTRREVEDIVKKLGGEVEAVLHDSECRSLYVLVKGVREPGELWKALHAKEMIELHETDHEDVASAD